MKIAKIRIVRTRKNFVPHGNSTDHFINIQLISFISSSAFLREHPVFERSDDRKYVCGSQATSALN